MQHTLTFNAMRSTDARELGRAMVGTQAAAGRVARVVRIEQLSAAPFTTTIVYEASDEAGDLLMPHTVRAATFVEMARRALERGGEHDTAGYWQPMSAADVLARYNALIAQANTGELL